jgi:hypothetical protein
MPDSKNRCYPDFQRRDFCYHLPLYCSAGGRDGTGVGLERREKPWRLTETPALSGGGFAALKIWHGDRARMSGHPKQA